jgi:hypothetical protein
MRQTTSYYTLYVKKPRKNTLLSQVYVYYNIMLMKIADLCFMQSTVDTHMQAYQYSYDLAKQKTIKGTGSRDRIQIFGKK